MAIRIAESASVQRTAESGSVHTVPSGFSQMVQNAEKSGIQKKSLDDIFTEASSKFQVPVNLLKGIARAESGYQTDAVSRCGAQGIMQLMPSTARSLGVQDSFDPEQNIMGGAKYIGGLLSRYGDQKLALAAYNAGSGNVEKYGGVPPFKETQNYVEKVLRYAEESGGLPEEPALEDAGMFSSVSGGSVQTSLFSAEDYRNFLELFTRQLRQEALDGIMGLKDDSSSKRDVFLAE